MNHSHAESNPHPSFAREWCHCPQDYMERIVNPINKPTSEQIIQAIPAEYEHHLSKCCRTHLIWYAAGLGLTRETTNRELAYRIGEVKRMRICHSARNSIKAKEGGWFLNEVDAEEQRVGARVKALKDIYRDAERKQYDTKGPEVGRRSGLGVGESRWAPARGGMDIGRQFEEMSVRGGAVGEEDNRSLIDLNSPLETQDGPSYGRRTPNSCSVSGPIHPERAAMLDREPRKINSDRTDQKIVHSYNLSEIHEGFIALFDQLDAGTSDTSIDPTLALAKFAFTLLLEHEISTLEQLNFLKTIFKCLGGLLGDGAKGGVRLVARSLEEHLKNAGM